MLEGILYYLDLLRLLVRIVSLIYLSEVKPITNLTDVVSLFQIFFCSKNKIVQFRLCTLPEMVQLFGSLERYTKNQKIVKSKQTGAFMTCPLPKAVELPTAVSF